MDTIAKRMTPLAALCAAVLLSASTAFGQISLGSAQSFAVLGGQEVTNTGLTVVTGNVGVSPGTSITGFGPGIIIGGSTHVNDAVAIQAQSDLTVAYDAIAGTPCHVDLTGQNLSGLTLTPDVYCFSSSAFLNGPVPLRLDMQGNPNAVFLFKIGSTLITSTGSSVVLINSGATTCPPNVFWQVGSSATIETTTSFVGNILALTSITLKTGATLNGRALARNALVSLDTNSVNSCAPAIVCPVIIVNPATLPNGAVGTPYNQVVSGSGGTAPYTYGVTSGTLPSGLTLNPATGAITGTPLTAGTSNFVITATDVNGCPGSRAYTIIIAAAGACPIITLSPATLPPGTVGSPYGPQVISAGGGTPPNSFIVSSGALPGGLSLNLTSGAITGTPNAIGLFSFTVRATDFNGCQGSLTYSIAIGAASVAASGPTLDVYGLSILMALVLAAGLIVMNKLSI